MIMVLFKTSCCGSSVMNNECLTAVEDEREEKF